MGFWPQRRGGEEAGTEAEERCEGKAAAAHAAGQATGKRGRGPGTAGATTPSPDTDADRQDTDGRRSDKARLAAAQHSSQGSQSVGRRGNHREAER